jgi:hypothetical protein
MGECWARGVLQEPAAEGPRLQQLPWAVRSELQRLSWAAYLVWCWAAAAAYWNVLGIACSLLRLAAG